MKSMRESDLLTPAYELFTNPLEDYTEVGTIGRGVYGQAILYHHKSLLGRHMVVKRISLDLIREHEVESALHELRALRQLAHHPNVVRFIDAWGSSGNVCVLLDDRVSLVDDLVTPKEKVQELRRCLERLPPAQTAINIMTEYVDGGSLDKLIELNSELRIEESLVGAWLAQMVLGVDYMHDSGLLHCDLKPSNVFITQSGVVKVGDLGCCQRIQKLDQQCKTEYRSPAYSSPETWMGGICSHKSDSWSLGCIAYELMAGHPAFCAPELTAKVLRATPAPLPEVYSPELRELAFAMLSKEPCERPSMKEMLASPYLSQRAVDWARVMDDES